MSDIQSRITAIQQEIEALQALLLELQAEHEASNPDPGAEPDWTAKDKFGGRWFGPLFAISDVLQENRAGRYYVSIRAEFSYNLLTILPVDSFDHNEMVMEAYARAQGQRLFYSNYQHNGGYLLKPGNHESNRLIWAGNEGPEEARERFEAYWTAPDALERTQAKADWVMAYLDHKYENAKLKPATLAAFEAEYPNYVPE